MRTAAFVLAITFVALPALARVLHVVPRAPVGPGTPGSAAAPAALGGPAAGSPSAAPVTVPPPPDVSDPMLAPVPTPKRVLRSWKEAVELLRSRSTDLRIAVDQVLQAEAQTRIALAQYLPLITGTVNYTHQILTNPSVSSGLGGFSLGTNGFVSSSRVPNPNSL